MSYIPDVMTPLSRGEMFVTDASYIRTKAVPDEYESGDNSHEGTYQDSWSLEDFLIVLSRQSVSGKVDKNQGEENSGKIMDISDTGNVQVKAPEDADYIFNPKGYSFTSKNGFVGMLAPNGDFVRLYKGEL